MDTSNTVKAAAYLANYPQAVLPVWQFEKQVDQFKGIPAIPTAFTLYTTKNLTLRLKPINSIGHRGMILRFHDDLIPRPFSKLERLEATFLAKEFKKYEVLELNNQDIVVVLDTCDDWFQDFGYDWMETPLITLTWKALDIKQG